MINSTIFKRLPAGFCVIEVTENYNDVAEFYIAPHARKQKLCLNLAFIFYHGDLLIAEHGSWNSSQKVDYQIVKLSLKSHGNNAIQLFITGWIHDDEVWGRPVDLILARDDAILISDDHAGVIYRIAKTVNTPK